MPEASPYSTAAFFGRAVPAHISTDAVEDLERVRAYETYADLFHNDPVIWNNVLEDSGGGTNLRRLVPLMRSVVEATNRYLGRGLTWVATPPSASSAVNQENTDAGLEAAQLAIDSTMLVLDELFEREEFLAKFHSFKRWGLIRGDGMFHLTHDPSKPAGKRIRVTELYPGSYFPMVDPADSERVVGCYIVNLIKDDDGEEIAARLEYRRLTTPEDASEFGVSVPAGGMVIYTRLTFWETDGWDDRRSDEDLKPVDTPGRFNADRMGDLLTGTVLPAPISAIPVYHWRNNRRGGAIFGTSEMQGLETLATGINQTASDEEVAIAMQGLGVYWTTGGKPTDSQGNEIPWRIAPAEMLEITSGEVGRLQGISSVQPSQDHWKALKAEALESSGTPDISLGRMDSGLEASGIALAIRMSPILVKNGEKELDLTGKLNQMVYDIINGWLPAIEGIQPNGTIVHSEFSDPLPKDRKAIIEEVIAMLTARMISAVTARTILREKLGMVFPEDEQENINAETAAALDLEGGRLEAAADPAAEVGL